MAATHLDERIRTFNPDSPLLAATPHAVVLTRARFLGSMHDIREWLAGPDATGRYAASLDRDDPNGGVTYRFEDAGTAAAMRDRFGGA